MNTILKLALVATLAIFAQNVQAQVGNNEAKEESKSLEDYEAKQKERERLEKQQQITFLKEEKVKVESYWKSVLKYRVRTIAKESEELGRSEEETEVLKKAYAQEVALNLQNELAIIDNQIALVERTGRIDQNIKTRIGMNLGGKAKEDHSFFELTVDNGLVGNNRFRKRSYGGWTLAFGLNNAITEIGDFGDAFGIGRSRFFEFGFVETTRILENSGALHLKYGLSLQINKLFVKDNQTLVRGDETSSFEEFPIELRKSQLRFTNLVVPVHLEFGGWGKEEKEDYVRYKTAGKFRMGVGGYAGVRLGTQQKLKFREDGERVKTKEEQDFGGDNFVYGLSSYIRLTGDLSVYGKYDLSTILNTENLGDVNSISLGLRWDW